MTSENLLCDDVFATRRRNAVLWFRPYMEQIFVWPIDGYFGSRSLCLNVYYCTYNTGENRRGW